ncbi:S-adenosylmethionine:tRNA ribosyltransferase-isomerase [Polymorphobacter multimanifer]|uniref:S-adenosylmethionine:tRNA ribosyltransferase-isomerase n=1 Tax=Polymorphobacter multimanifer TaxID=1070431 RepID=A0A841L251_9SPHN|nr:tRNA preQ1(34) S-adenosylmethionine ribosyltransferase-isomerase QueA [Polymorphobacter multimanifer]MBB6226889.1 S-adenosylmethionine:tRNA ribosyltransferase-isomerase [Polymorphobacter multimanifer]
MLVSDFDFELPAERIALRPVSPRDSARMLEVRDSGLADLVMRDLPARLQPGDVLVVNDTRVIPAQFRGRRGEATVGVTLHKREGAARWWAFVKNVRRLAVADRVDFGSGLFGVVEEMGAEGAVLWRFEADNGVEAAMMAAGVMPLPPYIASKRAVDDRDAEDYQTLHAAKDGAVAAPTAGLHFTPELWAALAARGVGREVVTLHVGAGTFLPVKAERTEDHVMHSEWGEVPGDVAARLNAARAAGGRVVAVGTTSLRVLESAVEGGRIGAFSGDTAIFITPGYRFGAVDGLVTNFHLPKSTLFMLVSALMSTEVMRVAYAHAIEHGYRFYSYGDGSLLLP